jgi:hypothetical protein
MILRNRLLRSSRLVLGFGMVVYLECNCSRDRALNGEIFIVTSGHESVKLGLVEVLAFQPDSLGRTVQSVKKKLPGEDARFNPVYAQIESLERRAKAAEEEASKAMSAAPDVWKRAFDLSNDCGTLAVQAKLHSSYLKSPGPFFESLPTAIASAKTDSDGKFTITVPRSGETIICAAADRKVGNSSEHYYWIVKAPPGRKALIALSNDNLATSASPQSVIHVLTDFGVKESIDDLRTQLREFENKLNALESDSVAAAQTPSPTQPQATPTQPQAIGTLPKTVILKQPVSVQLRDGSVFILPQGGRFEFVSKAGSEVLIRYRDGEYAIPSSAVDLE